MTCFYPGPSQLAPGIDDWMAEAYSSGILSRNHRSAPFMELYADTREVIREKLLVPEGFELVFTSSATECWEILSESFPGMPHNHYFCGAFGEKWYQYALRINPTHYNHPFTAEAPIIPEALPESGVICLTQCETSNGTFASISEDWKRLNPNALIAVDATSSLGGIFEKIEHADIWFASAQKCFGLPSGMGVMLISPEAQNRAHSIDVRTHYNSLSWTLDNAHKNQTPYTPNILDIFLLNRVIHSRPVITDTDQLLRNRMVQLDLLVEQHEMLDFLVQNKAARSPTVMAIKATPEHIIKIKHEALDAGMILGNGYGHLKQDTFRIANFPAIQESEWGALLDFLGNIDH